MDAENCTDTQLWYDKKCTEMDEFCSEFGYDNFENNTHCINPREDYPGFNETIALPEGRKNSKRFLQFIVSPKKVWQVIMRIWIKVQISLLKAVFSYLIVLYT